MLTVLKQRLDEYNVFDIPEHPFVDALIQSVPFDTVPSKMKMAFALSHLSNYASQFRRNMMLWDGTLVPTNNITFVIADSGANKDSSNNKIRKCFSDGFKSIRKKADAYVTEKAIRAAKRAGEDLPDEPAVYRKYIKQVPPHFISMTTGAGLIQHIGDLSDIPVLSGSLYSGEIGDELAYNPHAIENIKVISECYDLGSREASYTKGEDFRTKEIVNQPVSALLVGSPSHILYDETTRKRFHVAFMSKLARRSWFCYTPDKVYSKDFSKEEDPITAMSKYEEHLEELAAEAVALIRGEVEYLTDYHLPKAGEAITLTAEVFELFNIYKRYNREVIEQTSSHDSLYALVRAHLQWKALKLAGALAIIESSDTVDVEHYTTAIQYCELFDSDIVRFDTDINKAPHECLADYLKLQADGAGFAKISVHDIKKKGFSTTVSAPKMQEMVTLCAGYDVLGVYSVVDNGGAILCERIIASETLGVSFVPIDNSKLNRAIKNKADYNTLKNIKAAIGETANTGLIYEEVSFADLAEMLKEDVAYSPFQYINGERSKDTLVGGTKWVVFDIDKTTMSYEDIHFVLDGINHHVVLTSDADNEYKYRVLIELDSYVELSPIAWKFFYLGIAEDLGLDVDVLPQAQLFYSYAGRPILSCIDGDPIAVRDYVMEAKERETTKAIEKPLTKPQQNLMLSDPFNTFLYAFECGKGNRSVTMYRAFRHAHSLGADLDYVLDLINQVNNYIVNPLGVDDIGRLTQQITRFYNERH